jgi:hypothetical protein
MLAETEDIVLVRIGDRSADFPDLIEQGIRATDFIVRLTHRNPPRAALV